MREIWKTRLRAFLIFALCTIVSACGGGGTSSDSPSTSPAPAKVLDWIPPSSFSDSAPLDPARDLQAYEIYVNETGVFSNSDAPTALVGAVDPSNGTPVTSFNLSNLGNYLSKGVTYHVSIRAVAMTGLKSDFAPPATFSL